MALVDNDQGVFRQILHQGGRWLAGISPGQVAGIVLDPLTVAHLLHHLQIEKRPMLETLGLQEFLFPAQLGKAFLEFGPDSGHGPIQVVPAGDIVTAGINGQLRDSS